MRSMGIRKIILIAFGTLTILILIWNYIGNYAICDHLLSGGSAGNCPVILTAIGINILPTIPLFLFSLITYKMPEKVFQAWAWFALPWSALSMALIYMAPEYGQSGFGPSISLDKGFVAFLMSGTFVILSILIIAVRYLTLRFRR